MLNSMYPAYLGYRKYIVTCSSKYDGHMHVFERHIEKMFLSFFNKNISTIYTYSKP